MPCPQCYDLAVQREPLRALGPKAGPCPTCGWTWNPAGCDRCLSCNSLYPGTRVGPESHFRHGRQATVPLPLPGGVGLFATPGERSEQPDLLWDDRDVSWVDPPAADTVSSTLASLVAAYFDKKLRDVLAKKFVFSDYAADKVP